MSFDGDSNCEEERWTCTDNVLVRPGTLISLDDLMLRSNIVKNDYDPWDVIFLTSDSDEVGIWLGNGAHLDKHQPQDHEAILCDA